LLAGLLLIVSSFFHFSNSFDFYNAILTYELVSFRVAWIIAAILPPIQIVTGTWLVLFRPQWIAACSFLILMTIYLFAQAWAWTRGLSIACHCFGPSDKLIGPGTIAFTGALWVIAAWHLRFVNKCRSRPNANRENRDSSGELLFAADQRQFGRQSFPTIPGRHGGFTVVEVAVCMAIIGVLAGLSFPAIQSLRESARSTACLNNLRTIGVAVQGYVTSRQRYPVGTLGFKPLLSVPAEVTYTDWLSNAAHPYHWQKSQHTSPWVFLLPYVEEEERYGLLPQNNLRTESIQLWNGNLPVVQHATSGELDHLQCPSDNLTGDPEVQLNVSSQPAIEFDSSGNFLRDLMLVATLPQPFVHGPTNYNFCSGAHSSGAYPIPGMNGYEGVFGCRSAARTNQIKDGLSQTILCGETIGTILDGKRLTVSSWAFGGLIRGRGGVPWGQVLALDRPLFFIGDSQHSWANGFGSRHPLTVNTCRADGSVHATHRGVELKVWYAMCGRGDGVAVTE
jgi:prepilin-type N-terminal cleavage/methylation domain-containing protein